LTFPALAAKTLRWRRAGVAYSCIGPRATAETDQGAREVASAVVAVMQTHSTSVHVAEYGCGALLYLPMNTENQVSLMAAGAAEVVLTAMRQHSANSKVAHYGCRALRGLAWNNAENLSRRGIVPTDCDYESKEDASSQGESERTYQAGELCLVCHGKNGGCQTGTRPI